MLIILCITAGLILALIPHILWFIGWICCNIAGVGLPYRYFGIAAFIIVILFWSALAYGYFWGRWKIESITFEYSHKNIPEAFDGFKIVHISDLHLSTFDDSPERLNSFIEEINRHCPDIVCFTGDMVTIGKSEAEPYTEILEKISATHGVLSVLGNHDFMIYGLNQDNRENAVQDLAEYQENILGWKLLRNENVVIESEDGSKITFVGVDNANFGNQGFPTIHQGDLKKALEGTDGFRILLSHDPSHWKAEVLSETDIPLTLSGHTHSAQIKILGWTPAKWSFDEIAGRYDNGDQTLYINVGLGCTAPFRLGVNPEVTVITLRSKNEPDQ
jgi:predicted MPP superfamily phosphohydrolase